MGTTEKNNDFSGVLKQYDEMKKKHPDAILLFRIGDFYECLKDDATKAGAVLDLTVNQRKEGRKTIAYAGFPHHNLDTYLPKLVRAGNRVAICEQLEVPTKKVAEKSRRTASDSLESSNEATIKSKTESKISSVPESPTQKQEEKKEQGKKEPQMITVNGDAITHGHAYLGNLNPQNWYFTAKMNGEQLKPQLMKLEDVLAYAKKEKSVQDMIKTYYPTKLMEKLPEEAFKLPKKITGPEGEMDIVKFNVYKEKNPASEDMGKYKFYAQVGEKKMSVLATKEDLSAYFDRTISPEKLVIKNFGERLHLPEAYAKYQLPEGITPKSILISKSPDGAWSVSADMGEKGKTSQARLSYDDGYAFFSSKSATREQLAAKYLSEEMKTLANSQSEKNEKTLKM